MRYRIVEQMLDDFVVYQLQGRYDDVGVWHNIGDFHKDLQEIYALKRQQQHLKGLYTEKVIDDDALKTTGWDEHERN